ncbi:hypothetical protein KY349_05265, partial [Candidatus Woesearchaeota archaeon]|nr:hypothetical protein [Candidatus Woesearchaeota archaeon]
MKRVLVFVLLIVLLCSLASAALYKTAPVVYKTPVVVREPLIVEEPVVTEPPKDDPYGDEYGIVTPTKRLNTTYDTTGGEARYEEPLVEDSFYVVKEVEEKVYEPMKAMETGEKGYDSYKIEMGDSRTHILLYNSLGQVSQAIIIDQETGQVSDLDALVQLVIFEMWQTEEESLKGVLEEMHRMNEEKKQQRDYMESAKLSKSEMDAVYSAIYSLLQQAQAEKKDQLEELQTAREQQLAAAQAAVEAKQEEIEAKKEAAEENFISGIVSAVKGWFIPGIEPHEATHIADDFTEGTSSDELVSSLKDHEIEMYEGHGRYGSGPDFDNKTTLSVKEQSGKADLDAELEDGKVGS